MRTVARPCRRSTIAYGTPASPPKPIFNVACAPIDAISAADDGSIAARVRSRFQPSPTGNGTAPRSVGFSPRSAAEGTP
jgi:hypothetical protein